MAADLGLVADAAERHADELAVERAGDRLADRRLAGAGRADQRQDRARALVLGDAALLAQLAHGQVLDDPVLHVLEARMVGVEHLARVDRVEPLLGALAPRHHQQPVEVGADHRRLGRLVAHPLEPGDLALGLLAHGVGQLRLGDPRAVVLGGGRVVLAELLADRLQLAAQDVLALLLGGAFLDVVADAPAHLQLGQPLALEPQGELEPLDHVDRLEQLDLLLEGRLRRVRDRVGERAGLADRADEGRRCGRRRRAARGSPRPSARYSRSSSRVLTRRRLLVGPLLDLDAQAPLRVGLRGAGEAAVQARQADGAPAARQTHASRRPRRRCRPSRTRLRAAARGSTRSSSPTSTEMVTFMFGKTTMSSSGTSSR